jgi:hypothetical protein
MISAAEGAVVAALAAVVTRLEKRKRNMIPRSSRS